MTLREICQWIEDNSAFIIGTTLVYGHRISEDTDRCVLASERTTGESDFYLPDKINKIVTFVARSASYEEASLDMDAIFALLHGKTGHALPTISSGKAYYACIIQSIGLPVYLGQDERLLHEFSCSFEFKIQSQ
jgi:hypothetical protein